MKDNNELQRAMNLLEKQGWNPMICDTPIAVSSCSVKCGIPTEIGDECIDDYWLLPKSLTNMQPEIIIRANGNSMIDAGYEDGDIVKAEDMQHYISALEEVNAL